METFKIESWYRNSDSKDFEIFKVKAKNNQEAVNQLAKVLPYNYFAFYINGAKIRPNGL